MTHLILYRGGDDISMMNYGMIHAYQGVSGDRQERDPIK